MTSISISQLKANPASAISSSRDYPIAVKNRYQTEAYLVGKELFEKMIALIEDAIDRDGIETTDLTKKRNFDEVVEELGL